MSWIVQCQGRTRPNACGAFQYQTVESAVSAAHTLLRQWIVDEVGIVNTEFDDVVFTLTKRSRLTPDSTLMLLKGALAMRQAGATTDGVRREASERGVPGARR